MANGLTGLEFSASGPSCRRWTHSKLWLGGSGTTLLMVSRSAPGTPGGRPLSPPGCGGGPWFLPRRPLIQCEDESTTTIYLCSHYWSEQWKMPPGRGQGPHQEPDLGQDSIQNLASMCPHAVTFCHFVICPSLCLSIQCPHETTIIVTQDNGGTGNPQSPSFHHCSK